MTRSLLSFLLLLLAACGEGPAMEAACEAHPEVLPQVRILNETPATPVSANLTVYGEAWRDDGAAITSVIVLGQLVTTRVDDYSAWEVDLPIELLRAAADSNGDVWIRAVAEDFCGIRNKPLCEEETADTAAPGESESSTDDTGAEWPRDCLLMPVAAAADEAADADTDTDTDAVAASSIVDHVITGLTIAGSGEGFDLDGDGTLDNAAGSAAAELDPVLAALLANAARVLVLQVADVESLVDDPSVWVALVSATDPDGDPADNAADETFTGGEAVDSDGRAVLGVDAVLASGAYSATLPVGTFALGPLEVATATPILLAGELSGGGHTGLLGFAVGVAGLTSALEGLGYAAAAAALPALADIDTDADGTADAVSIVLRFDAVTCGLTQ